MTALIEEWSRVEIRSVIRFLHAKGKGPTEIHRELLSVYGENVMTRKQVSLWCTAFAEGRTNVEDDHRSGRPCSSSTDDNIAQVDNLIKADRRCKIRDIALELDISKTVAHEIVHEKLGYRKVSLKIACQIIKKMQKIFFLSRFQQDGSQSNSPKATSQSVSMLQRSFSIVTDLIPNL